MRAYFGAFPRPNMKWLGSFLAFSDLWNHFCSKAIKLGGL